MSIYGGKELGGQFRIVRQNTVQIAEDIPQEQCNHVPAPECRSVGQMLTHIAVAPQMWEEVHGKQRRAASISHRRCSSWSFSGICCARSFAWLQSLLVS